MNDDSQTPKAPPSTPLANLKTADVDANKQLSAVDQPVASPVELQLMQGNWKVMYTVAKDGPGGTDNGDGGADSGGAGGSGGGGGSGSGSSDSGSSGGCSPA